MSKKGKRRSAIKEWEQKNRNPHGRCAVCGAPTGERAWVRTGIDDRLYYLCSAHRRDFELVSDRGA